MTTALLATLAVAALLTLTLMCRPLIAIPGGLLATVAWWVASSTAADLDLTVPAVAYLALGITTGAYAVHDGLLVARRERARIAERREQERDDLYWRHALAAVENFEEAGR